MDQSSFAGMGGRPSEASIASGYQVCDPICAYFPTAPIYKNKLQIIFMTLNLILQEILEFLGVLIACRSKNGWYVFVWNRVKRPEILGTNPKSPTWLTSIVFVAVLSAWCCVNQNKLTNLKQDLVPPILWIIKNKFFKSLTACLLQVF